MLVAQIFSGTFLKPFHAISDRWFSLVRQKLFVFSVMFYHKLMTVIVIAESLL